MASTTKLDQAISAALTDTDAAITDLRSRKNAAQQTAAVSTLSSYQLLLKQYQSATPASTVITAKLALEARITILPLLADLIANNIKYTQMGPLNTKRVIEPGDAFAQNKILEKLEGDARNVAAEATAVVSREPPASDLKPPVPAPESDCDTPFDYRLPDLIPEKIQISPFDPHALPGQTEATIYVPKPK